MLHDFASFEEVLPDLLKDFNGVILKHVTFHDMEFLGMNLEADEKTMQNHSYYFGNEEDYYDQVQNAMANELTEVSNLRSSRSSSRSAGKLEIPELSVSSG